MGLDEFTWTVAPRSRHRVARALALSVFWLLVLVVAVALGWLVAEVVSNGGSVVP